MTTFYSNVPALRDILGCGLHRAKDMHNAFLIRREIKDARTFEELKAALLRLADTQLPSLPGGVEFLDIEPDEP